jgi:hypothetical protein
MRSPTPLLTAGTIGTVSGYTRESGVAKRMRRDCAQILLRMEPAERARIRAAIPRGSLNAVAIRLLLDYAQMIEANSPRPPSPVEGSAA